MKHNIVSVNIPVRECNHGLYCNFYDGLDDTHKNAPLCRFLKTNGVNHYCILYELILKSEVANIETGGDLLVYRPYECGFSYGRNLDRIYLDRLNKWIFDDNIRMIESSDILYFVNIGVYQEFIHSGEISRMRLAEMVFDKKSYKIIKARTTINQSLEYEFNPNSGSFTIIGE